jgi:hypothetical protein
MQAPHSARLCDELLSSAVRTLAPYLNADSVSEVEDSVLSEWKGHPADASIPSAFPQTNKFFKNSPKSTCQPPIDPSMLQNPYPY